MTPEMRELLHSLEADMNAVAPPAILLTRTEVLALLERWKVEPPVDERTLRYWEKRGLVPRPSRHYHNGAVRTRYPAWVADLVYYLRVQQAEGHKLDDLMPKMLEQEARLARLPRTVAMPAKPSLVDAPPRSQKATVAALVALCEELLEIAEMVQDELIAREVYADYRTRLAQLKGEG